MIKVDVNYIKENFADIYLEDLKKLIKIPSISLDKKGKFPFGKPCNDALNYVIEFCKNIGADNLYKDAENYYAYADFGEGDETLGILCHLDVVEPGDISKWKTNPFEPVVIDNYIYARGSADTKGPTIDVLYAIKYLKQNGYDFKNKKIRLVFGIDEEILMTSLKKYKKDFGDFTLGSIVVEPVPGLTLKQKGNISFEIVDNQCEDFYIKGGQNINVICDKVELNFNNKDLLSKYVSEISKTDLNYELFENSVFVFGLPGHGSTPEAGANSILKSASIFNKIGYKKNNVINWVNEFIADDFYLKKHFDYQPDETGNLTINLGYFISNKLQRLGCDIRVNTNINNNEIVSKIKKFAKKK